jgi:colanic acid biosynthesis glycosyl transferase WcaI
VSRRILFLNQYFPPDPAPTGALMRELGGFLELRGWTAQYVASGQDYRAAKGGSRAVRELRGLGAVLRRGLAARRADVVFSGTSPPCLAVAAALVAKAHRAVGVHWMMDMYPELAVVLGELKDGPVPAFFRKLMRQAYRSMKLVVALDADMAARLRRYEVEAEVIPPWVMKPLLGSAAETSPESEPVWIYSGNLGRAHEWETLLEAQALLEARGSRWRLRFQGGGPAWAAAKDRAARLGLSRCEWQPYAAENELRSSLSAASAVIVTQRPEAQGLLWPSKLALALDVSRPVVWVGPTDGAIAAHLRSLEWIGVFAPGEAGKLADWLGALEREGTAVISRPGSAAETRSAALERWAVLLEQTVS